MQHRAANQLHIKVPHLQDAPSRLAHHGKGLRQQLVQRFVLGLDALVGIFNASDALANPRAKLFRLGSKLRRRRAAASAAPAH